MSVVEELNKIFFTSNGSILEYSFPFRVFDNDNISVLVVNSNNEIEELSILLGQYSVEINPDTQGGVVTLQVAPPPGDTVVIFRETPLVQTGEFTRFGFDPRRVETRLDFLTVIAQDNREMNSRSLKVPIANENFNPELPFDLEEGDLISVSAGAEGFEKVLKVDQVIDLQNRANEFESALDEAEASELAAQAAQGAAEMAQALSEAARSEAQAAAQQSTDAAAVSQYRDIEYLTFADSPRALTIDDAGIFFNVDTSMGDVVFTLPEISTLDLTGARPFFGGRKTSPDINSIIVQSVGTDVINQDGQSISANVQNNGYRFIPDTDLTPNSWTAIAISTATGGSSNPTLIEGTGGRIVTQTSDFISGGLGSVPGAGVYQIQNAPGTIVYQQQLSGQERKTVNITELRHRYAANTITSTGIATRVINEVNMAATGQEVQVAGNSNQGYDMYFFKRGGEPFTIVGSLGASLPGHPNGIFLQNDGDSVHIHQFDQTTYVVKGISLAQNNGVFNVDLRAVGGQAVIPNGTRVVTVTDSFSSVSENPFGFFANELVLPDASAHTGQTITIREDSPFLRSNHLGLANGDKEPVLVNDTAGTLRSLNDDRLRGPKEFLVYFSDGTNWVNQYAGNTLRTNRTVRTLNTSLVSNTNPITDLTLIGLEVGRSYELFMEALFSFSPNQAGRFRAFHNGDVILAYTASAPSESGFQAAEATISRKFIASATTVTFQFTENSTAILLQNGNPNGNTTVELHELNYNIVN